MATTSPGSRRRPARRRRTSRAPAQPLDLHQRAGHPDHPGGHRRPGPQPLQLGPERGPRPLGEPVRDSVSTDGSRPARDAAVGRSSTSARRRPVARAGVGEPSRRAPVARRPGAPPRPRGPAGAARAYARPRAASTGPRVPRTPRLLGRDRSARRALRGAPGPRRGPARAPLRSPLAARPPRRRRRRARGVGRAPASSAARTGASGVARVARRGATTGSPLTGASPPASGGRVVWRRASAARRPAAAVVRMTTPTSSGSRSHAARTAGASSAGTHQRAGQGVAGHGGALADHRDLSHGAQALPIRMTATISP